jgi:hypothetical protein
MLPAGPKISGPVLLLGSHTLPHAFNLCCNILVRTWLFVALSLFLCHLICANVWSH